MRITFHGAARTVTGSRHLVETTGGRVLLDCGMVQGPRRESAERNRNFGFDAKSVDAVVLSHAHIDHAGVLPKLVADGYDGNIFCTPATRDLAEAMLLDSANVQVADAAHLNRNKRPSEPEVMPLYGVPEAREAIARLVTIPYGRTMSILPHVTVRFQDAGHILGSAVTVLTEGGNGRARKVVFTGDIGRRAFPILRDVEPVEQGDVFITESTYGSRDHNGSSLHAKSQLLEVVKRTTGRGGRLLVPAFALGRAQTLAYLLHELWVEKRLARFPIYVDSPLSLDVTSIYRLHPECYDRETLRWFQDDLPSDPFGFGELRYVRTVEESKALNGRDGPCLIIAASGMCEGGRILHHLKHGIGDTRNTVLMVGYCAQHTLGRRLADGAKVARIFGDEFHVRCEVARLDGISQHADRRELLDYAATQKKAGSAFVVHGEADASEAMAEGMRQAGFGRVEVPALGQSFDV